MGAALKWWRIPSDVEGEVKRLLSGAKSCQIWRHSHHDSHFDSECPSTEKSSNVETVFGAESDVSWIPD